MLLGVDEIGLLLLGTLDDGDELLGEVDVGSELLGLLLEGNVDEGALVGWKVGLKGIKNVMDG